MKRIQRGYLEFFLVDHCNLRCAHCSHFSPYMKPWSPELVDFKRDIRALAEVMQVGRFRFLGGEPLLNRQLPDFIDAVLESDLSRSVGLCTNGVLLHKVKRETLAKLDWLDVSLYPGTRPDSETIRETAERICDELDLTLHLFPKPDFRYQLLESPIEDEQAVEEIFRTCKMAHGGWDMFHDGCHTLYKGMYYRCNRPAYTKAYLSHNGCEAEGLPDFAQVDGVPLHEQDLQKRLLDYLLSERPLESCKWCLGTCGVRLPHRMMSRDEVKLQQAQDVSLEDVLDRDALEEGARKLKPVKSRTRRTLRRML
jgi:organic radical activating enzyme